ncbi:MULTISPECIES: hypothetical protein [Bradyrhizobium]|uniref:hypothetical protein n=1 Tax=Bradyrhizobium TaxID=374 RepID=UPI0012FD4A4E|nr:MULTISPECIES: hypothetical protein [Bradyrhizobium]MDI2073791.1 hypothetical protein [Bradyrhizobium sp. Mp27]
MRAAFDHHTNYAYVVGVAAEWSEVDGEHGEQPSTVEVYENGVRLGPAHSSVSDVVMIGGGRYRYMEVDSVNHTSGIIYSMTTDPNTNGRLYRVFRTVVQVALVLPTCEYMVVTPPAEVENLEPLFRLGSATSAWAGLTASFQSLSSGQLVASLRDPRLSSMTAVTPSMKA